MANLLGIEPFEEALFFDNDKGHIKNVGQCPHIKSILVSGKDDTCRCGQRVAIHSPEYIHYIEELSPSGRAAVNVIVRILLGHGETTEALDLGSGIQTTEVKFIKSWVQENKNKKLAIFFDYDRTLSTIEGGFYSANSFQELLLNFNALSFSKEQGLDLQPYLPAFTLEGFVEYYVGGPSRLAVLKEMFDYLFDNNVTPIILTNNTACPTRKNLFREMVGVLTRKRDIPIICGAEYNYDKKKAIEKQPSSFPGGSLQKLCAVPREELNDGAVPKEALNDELARVTRELAALQGNTNNQGGGRRRKTRRQKKKSKKTHKRKH